MGDGKPIEIDCPVCHAKLEVDPGFAGGVCRCHACGTLMTVPAKPSERIEVLYQRDQSSAAGKWGEPTATRADQETVELESAVVLRTESGREVEVHRDHIGHGRRRRVLRGTIVIAFVGVAVALIAAAVFAVGLVVSQDLGANEEKEPDRSGIDRKVNPFTASSPTLFGMPVKSPVVVVVDATASSQRWLDLASIAIDRGIRNLDDGTKATVLFCSEARIERFPPPPEPSAEEAEKKGEAGESNQPASERTGDGGDRDEGGEGGASAGSEADASGESSGADAATRPELPDPWKPVGEWDLDAWSAFREGIRPRGLADVAVGVEQAAKWEPKQIILIGGSALGEMNHGRLRGLLVEREQGDPIPLDVVMIGPRMPEALEELLAATRGVSRVISERRLIRWYREAPR